MRVLKADRPVVPPKSYNNFFSVSIILVALLVVAIYVNNAYKSLQRDALPQGTVLISQTVLEEKYGLRVNLVAVTAGGGLVDLRLKIIDGEKAKSLLQDSNNFPSLWIADGNINLAVSEETKSQEIKFENDGNLFVMFPNSHSVVKPGTPVSVRFGSTQVEPIPAK
jgi:hypothetical protein